MLHLLIGEDLTDLTSVPARAPEQRALKNNATAEAEIERQIPEGLVLNAVAGEQFGKGAARAIVFGEGVKPGI